MKFTKIAALAAVAVMACGVFYGCGEATTSTPAGGTTSSQAQQQETTLTGTWKFGGIKADDGKIQTMDEYIVATVKAQTGETVDTNSDEYKQVMEMMKPIFDALDSLRIEIKDGGTVTQTASANGQNASMDGTYTVEGDQVAMTVGGQTSTYTFDAKAGTLSVEQNGMTIAMVKA